MEAKRIDLSVLKQRLYRKYPTSFTILRKEVDGKQFVYNSRLLSTSELESLARTLGVLHPYEVLIDKQND